MVVAFQPAKTQNNNSEYADLVVDSFFCNYPGCKFTSFYGGIGESSPMMCMNPGKILGNNTKYFVSLPKGSYITIKFTDNYVIDYPNQDDIFISEIGCSNDHAEVYVSPDNKHFFKLGIIDDCRTNSLDLASINYKDTVRFVKVVGLDYNGSSPGYDVVNIKGLPNSNVDLHPQKASPSIKRNKVSKINFDFNSSQLEAKYFPTLDRMIDILKKNPSVKIQVTGYTDSIGNDDYNIKLSTARAKSVADYIQEKGIASKRVIYEGKGAQNPVRANYTEEGRLENRRVELSLIK
jgi:outer membrane protein OmpA-like peptidoglycan-associated protein